MFMTRFAQIALFLAAGCGGSAPKGGTATAPSAPAPRVLDLDPDVMAADEGPGSVDNTPPSTSPGILDNAGARRIIRRHRGEVAGCYATAYKTNADLRGTLSVTFTVAADGGVTGASATGVGNDALHRCVAASFNALRFFPASDGAATIVNYRIQLVGR